MSLLFCDADRIALVKRLRNDPGANHGLVKFVSSIDGSTFVIEKKYIKMIPYFSDILNDLEFNYENGNNGNSSQEYYNNAQVPSLSMELPRNIIKHFIKYFEYGRMELSECNQGENYVILKKANEYGLKDLAVWCSYVIWNGGNPFLRGSKELEDALKYGEKEELKLLTDKLRQMFLKGEFGQEPAAADLSVVDPAKFEENDCILFILDDVLCAYNLQNKMVKKLCDLPLHEGRISVSKSTLVYEQEKNKLWIIGGLLNPKEGQIRAHKSLGSKRVLSVQLKKNPNEMEVIQCPSLKKKKSFFEAFLFKNNIYTFGGFKQHKKSYEHQIEYFDTDNKQEGKICHFDMSTNLELYGMAALEDKIYFVGGTDLSWVLKSNADGFSFWQSHESVKVYNLPLLANEEGSVHGDPLQSLNESRIGVRCVTLNDKIYAMGGSASFNTTFKRSVEVFDPQAHEWHYCASMNHPRSMGGVFEKDGFIYYVGGESEETQTMEAFNPVKNEWTLIPSKLPKNGSYNSVAYVNFAFD